MKDDKYQPNINVLTRVKKKGSQDKQLEAEVVLGKIRTSSSRIGNLFTSMVIGGPTVDN